MLYLDNLHRDPVVHLPEEYLVRNQMWDLLPESKRPHLLVVKSKNQIADIPLYADGRAKTPRKPIEIVTPNGDSVIVAGLGATEASELEDMVYEQFEKTESKPVVDVGEWRERHGYGRLEDFDTNVKEALAAKVRHHLANWRTDPAPVWVRKPKGNIYGYNG